MCMKYTLKITGKYKIKNSHFTRIRTHTQQTASKIKQLKATSTTAVSSNSAAKHTDYTQFVTNTIM